MNEIKINALTLSEEHYLFKQSNQLCLRTGFIGYLRADFDSNGLGFYTTWFDHKLSLNTPEFSRDIDRVINTLRENEGILSKRGVLSYHLYKHPEWKLHIDQDWHGVRIDSEHYTYMLRLNDRKGDYNCYCYCYKRDLLDQHIALASKGIRFIDSSYNEKFRIADGEKVRLITAGGEFRDMRVRYIDDYHMETNAEWGNTLYHICEFAERFEERGCQDIFPLRSSLPERCYSILDSTGDIIIIQKGDKGYYHIEVTEATKEENRALVDSQNEKLGISKAQEEAMKAGSIFGWACPAADPDNYNNIGVPKNAFALIEDEIDIEMTL